MKSRIAIVSFFIFLIFTRSFAQHSAREIIFFEQNWKFSNIDNAAAKEELFDASGWNTVNLPHDWSFEKGISRNGIQGPTGGYHDGGIGWYRYTYNAAINFADKTAFLEFDAVYRNSEVWVNGTYLGKRPYGYISFRYEISKYLKPGNNSIAVRVDNSQEPSARWYHPCGIYAPVRLIVTGKTFITPNAVAVVTNKVIAGKAHLAVQTNILSAVDKKQGLQLYNEIINQQGKIVASQSQPIFAVTDSGNSIATLFIISAPQLWSPQSPHLYKLHSVLKSGNTIIDEQFTSFGIRTIKWDAQTGFWLNNKSTKLLGVCEHYEAGPVGGAWTKPMLRWKLSLLKEMGVNAIRTAHNPCPPMFYDLCDELGIMVMDEIFDGWSKKAAEDYGKQAFNECWKTDMQEWITRGRNHPSGIIYSVGNETRGEVAKELVDFCHSLDSTRLVTSGSSGSQYMDVYGVNGPSERMDFYTKQRPAKAFIATEAPHTWQTRGYYRSKTWLRDGNNEKVSAFPLPDLTPAEIFRYEWAASDKWANNKQHFNSSYDNATVRISARKNWEILRDSAWYSGSFRWTGFDYYGEASYVHGGWPFRLFMSGALDVAGFKKDLFYFYQSQWTQNPMLHILPHWTHPLIESGTKIPVWIYSNCEEVELFLNGKSLGKKKPGKKWNEMQCEWLVPYQKGTLQAIGYSNGKKITASTQSTSGTPASLRLHLDDKYISVSKHHTAIVTAVINDNKGVLYPYGENKLHYYLEGPAHILSLENGDPVDSTKNVGLFQKKAFMGMSNAFIQLDTSASPVSIITGAILGEKQLLTSNQVAIDVQQLSLRGKMPIVDFKIYYTVDGLAPTTQSKRYTGPFIIKLGTTVKAIVMQGAKQILTMEESFGEGLGVYWYATGNDSSIPEGMKAVDAEFKGVVVKEANSQKFLVFDKPEGYVHWYQENDGPAGFFTLTFYLQSPEDDQQCNTVTLYVNSKKAEAIKLQSRKLNEAGWQVMKIRYQLNAGGNDIVLRNENGCRMAVYMMDAKPGE